MRNWTPAIPLVAALGVSVMSFGALPSAVPLNISAVFTILPRVPAETMPRAAAAMLFPAVAAFVWALLAWGARLRATETPFPDWLASEATGASAIAKFASTFNTIIFAIVSGVCVMHVAILGAASGWPSWTLNAAFMAIGLLTIIMGNVIPRARPNWIVGIRTKGTLSSHETWIRTHRLLGLFSMITGALVCATAVASVQYAALLWIAGILVSAAAAHLLGNARRAAQYHAL